MFITINSGSIIFYLFVSCLSCLNINRVCKTFILILFLYNCFSSFHLFDSLARTSCKTGLNKPKLQSLENKVFEFEFEFSCSLEVFSMILLFLYVYYYE